MFKDFLKIIGNCRGEVGGDGEPAPNNSIITEDDPAPSGDPAPDEGGDPKIAEGLKSLYGDLADKIEWPEGLDDDIKLQPSLKSFINDEGKLRVNDVLKSYVNAQKIRNEKGVIPPNEHSPKEEWDEYFAKVGYTPDPKEYDLGEKSKDVDVTDDFLESLKKTLHENRVPLDAAKKIKGFFEEQAKNSMTKSHEELKSHIEEGIESLKKEFGAAYEEKLSKGRQFFKETFGEDEEMMEAFQDPRLGSNKHIIKLLTKMGEEKYSEANLDGKPRSEGLLSPDEAQDEIAKLQANPAYWNSSHPEYKVLQKKSDKLYRMVNGER